MKRLLLLILLLLPLTGCKSQKYTVYYTDVFDTFSTFSCYADSEKEFNQISDELHQYLIELNKKFDIYNNYDGINNLKTINDNAGIKPVEVDNDIFELIKTGKKAYTDTNGTINIAMGSVLNVWHNYRTEATDSPEKASIPSYEELKEAEKYTDINNVILDEENSTVFINNKNTKIDVGAIAKGYCGDKVKEFLIEKDITAALLNLGGNVVCINDDNKPSWNIGVQNPDNEQEYIKEIPLTNQSAVTSGNYQRYYEYNGKKYHHIIDKNTLMPSENNKSVTIIADSSTIGDMLSTALFILPYEDGKELAEKYNIQVIWVTKDDEIKSYP